ncbi:MAG: DUF6478 family protein [Pseudomonadota bacterium]
MLWKAPIRLGDPVPPGIHPPSDCDLVLAPVPLGHSLRLAPAPDGHVLAPRFALHHDGRSDPKVAHDGALILSTESFDGTYLSLTLTLGKEAATSLARHHLIHLHLTARQSVQRPIFARLSAESGPNTDVLTEELPGEGPEHSQCWDLFHTGFDALRPGKIWIDVIFAPPPEAQIQIKRLVLLRTPRGGF